MCKINNCDQAIVNSGMCRTHYNQKMAKYASDKYYRRRAEWIEKKGGSCVKCGTTENLEFDHVDADTKEYDVAAILSSHREDKIAKEMEKCQLLCKPCHLEKTLLEEDIYIVKHGGGLTGKKNCHCDLCGPLKSAYNMRYKPVPKWSRKRELVHGDRAMYTGKNKCRCDLCKKAQREYMKEYNSKTKSLAAPAKGER